MRSKLVIVPALALLLCASLAGLCGSTAHAASTSSVRVIQAAVGTGAVDVYLDGGSTPLVSNVGFGQVGDYVPLSAGSHTVAVAPSGKPATAAIATASVTASAGATYTVAVVGDGSGAPQLVTFQDDNTVASGMAKVRVYHLSPDAGLAAVVTGGQTVIPNIDFKQASKYLTVKPGSYTFDLVIQHGGTSVPLNATLQANIVTSVFGVGSVNAASGSPTAFKFVVATAAAMPSGLPQTGFNPHPQAQAASSAAPPAAVWVLVPAIALLLLLAAVCYSPTRRRLLLAVRRG
ncbi:MAG TPA: DUF4397 domain-containing protein [Ktedonobacterales bacterium]|nr:DUF4397 domain-containing protein [Ktedonobacterales bacterium]